MHQDWRGLTDVQALLKASTPRVNEINARLSSQTPTVVYQSTRINMVELVNLFVDDSLRRYKLEKAGSEVCGETLDIMIQGVEDRLRSPVGALGPRVQSRYPE